ncbi:MAG: hypothetical protein LBC83_07530 [Oscillospiraceae bacterium]|jgi:hypothetical protein|nr:hypothetical protein [Oscillospiraceae bacterium]
MGKKASEEVLLENFQRIQAYFREVVPEAGRYSVVYGCGVDVGLMNYAVVRTTTYKYTSYLIGYDPSALEILLLPVNVELTQHGDLVALRKAENKSVKFSRFTGEYTVKNNVLKKKYVQFSVPECISEDPDNVCILVRQDDAAKTFQTFFKNQYS